jgi:hypothetical protein
MLFEVVNGVILSQEGVSDDPNWTTVIRERGLIEGRETRPSLLISGIIRGKKSELRPPKSKSDIWKVRNTLTINCPTSKSASLGSDYAVQPLYI